ncbi:MAG: Rid family detoxifying hydrolase [Devosiaceae bacterium]|nr:Rid family detoxifying hydrolase [Devosiaceae bacterium MH13]
MALKTVTAEGAPPAVGPYSHAVKADDVLYVSGCLALDETGTFLGGDAAAQAEQAMSNLGKVLAAEGLGPSDVAKCVVFLTDMADFQAVNAVYGAFFGDHKPARSCIAVAALPLGATVEVEAIAKAG